MKLYEFPRSSASYRVRIALNLKALKPEIALVNFRTQEQRSPEYRAIAPSGLVPALVDDDGTAVSQSIAIIRYLDRKHPTPRLIPEAPAAEALVMEVALAIACDIHPLNNLRVLEYLGEQLGLDESARNAWYAHWVITGFVGLEARLQECAGDYCVGDNVSLADVCLVPQVFNARRYKVDISRFPTIIAIDERLRALEAFAAAAPPPA